MRPNDARSRWDRDRWDLGPGGRCDAMRLGEGGVASDGNRNVSRNVPPPIRPTVPTTRVPPLALGKPDQ